MSERQFAVSGDWALGADSLQWILYRRASKRTGQWQAVSFVASTRVILERCMREKGCPAACQLILLAGLPPSPPTRRRRDDRSSGLSGSEMEELETRHHAFTDRQPFPCNAWLASAYPSDAQRSL